MSYPYKMLLRILQCIAVALLILNFRIVHAEERTGTVGSELTGGKNDDGPNVLNANVVVLLTSNTFDPSDCTTIQGVCTGTLLTPTLVLTARHCINGNSGMKTTVSGLGRTPGVFIGPSTSGLGLKPFTSVVKTVVFGEPIGGPYLPNDPKTVSENMGNDIAVLFLDPKKPVLNDAIISRIAFRNPILGGRDVNGGIYKPLSGEQFGIAGWSLNGAIGLGGCSRQVALFASNLGIHHYPGRPEHSTGVADGQFWLRNLSGPVTWPGDSGSPVFIQHSDGAREVFGVLSGTVKDDPFSIGGEDDIDCRDECALYTDISRGAPKEWLQKVVQDNTRSAEWLRFHKRKEIWFGEVDYTGPCNKVRDQDCDGWYDENDYCPKTFNPDQLENADGVGAACAACPRDICPPPPPKPPTNCRIGPFGAKCGHANIQCDAPLPETGSGGEFEVIANPGNRHLTIDFIYSPWGRIDASNHFISDKINLSVCTVNASGRACSNEFPVDFTIFPDCSHVGGVPPGFTCPHGTILCRNGMCEPLTSCRKPQ